MDALTALQEVVITVIGPVAVAAGTVLVFTLLVLTFVSDATDKL